MSGSFRLPRHPLRNALVLPLLTALAVGCGDDNGTDPNQPPGTPSIAAPADGATFGIGQEVQFQGSATDPEDGALTGASLVWTSSLDGQLGTGGSFARSDLSEGNHEITLTATDSDGDDASASVTITVANQPPAAPTITSPADGAEFGVGQEIEFSATATDPEDGELTGESIVWSSDLDGELGTGVAVTRDDLSEGTHQITVTATDSDGESASSSIEITVQNQPPIATITAPADGTVVAEGSDVTFEGSADDIEEGPLTGESLVWESDLDGEIGTGTTFTVNDLSLGEHTITLTATDSEDASGTATVALTVQGAPTAAIDAPADGATVTSGDAVTFEGSATDAEGGDLTGASLVWTSDLDDEIGTGESFTIDDLTVGTHTITLTATDSDGLTGTASIELTVQSSDQDPTVSITQPSNGATFAAGTSVTFEATASDPQDGALTGGSLVWESDVDGQIGTGTSFSTSTLSTGTHDVTVTATDSDSRTASAGVTIEILNPPTATITAPATGSSFESGTDVTFEGTGSDPDDGALTGGSLVWTSSRDGQFGTDVSVTTSSLSVGTHTITLTATDSDGLTGTDQITVTIDPPGSPPTATITSPADGSDFDEGVQIDFEGTGSDPDDGALTGSSLVWTSSIDGEIGSGESISRDDLSAGTHTITLTATDSDNRSGTDQITVTVNSTSTPIVIQAGATASSTINVGQQTTIPIIVDMSNAGGRDVASLTVEVTWDEGVAEYISYNQLAGGSEFVNEDDVATGSLNYSWFTGNGNTATFDLFEITFEGAGAGSATITLNVTALAEEDATNLLPDMSERNHTLTVN